MVDRRGATTVRGVWWRHWSVSRPPQGWPHQGDASYAGARPVGLVIVGAGGGGATVPGARWRCSGSQREDPGPRLADVLERGHEVVATSEDCRFESEEAVGPAPDGRE